MNRLVRLLVLVLLAGSPVWAQEAATPDETLVDTVPEDVAAPDDEIVAQDAFPDQADWNTFANRVEDALDVGQASNVVFANLRRSLAGWRDQFLGRETINSSRIATVSAQLASLGVVPEGGTEDPRIAARREALEAELRALRAPGLLATEAYTRANGLIAELDAIIRERQADRFIERRQSPLMPTGWISTLSATSDAVAAMRGEIATAVASPTRRSALLDVLPAVLVLLAIAVVGVLRGRVWFGRISDMILARLPRGAGVAAFALSLGGVIIPFVGLLAFSTAMGLTNMTGPRLWAIIDVLPQLGLFPILAHWIAFLLLPKNVDAAVHPLAMTQQVSEAANRRFIYLGYAMMAFAVMQIFTANSGFEDVQTAVAMYPFGLLVAWTLYWFAHTVRVKPVGGTDEPTRSFRASVRSMLCRGLKIAALGGVVLASLGYANAFEAITFPAGETIYVLAVLVLLQRLSVDLYALLSRSDNAGQTALMPVLIGFVLILAALPVLALIWGAQVTDLTEVWAQFREGFSIGETRISPTSFLLFAIIFVAGYTVTRLVQAALRTTVLPRTKLDAGGQNAIVAGTGYLGIFAAAIIAITTAGIDLSGLAIVAGALSVGIGFGMQNIVSNFVSGIILLIERPISQGDWIEVGGQMGYVRDISVRSTRIETFDRTDLIVPNSDLVSGTVTNYTRGNSVGRVIIKVGVAYGTDTRLVEEILREIAEAQPMVLLNPPPGVIFAGFGASSLDFEIRVLLRDVTNYWVVYTEINHQINERLEKEGIEIPFAQQDLWLRNPDAVAEAFAPNPAAKKAEE